MEADRRAEVWAKTAGRCWYCGTQTSPWKDFHVEHSVPKSKGGTDDLTNLVPSCQPCNNRKRDKDIEEFRAYLQTKAEHRFWFEHAGLPVVVAQPEIEEDEEEYPPYKEFPDEEDWQDFHGYCFRGIHRGPAFVLTTLYLLTCPMEWVFQDGDNGIYCIGDFSLDWLAERTGQSPHLLLTHLFWLQELEFLSIKYDQPGEYQYEFFIGRYIETWQQVDRTLRENQVLAIAE